jgi:hypothetical protein
VARLRRAEDLCHAAALAQARTRELRGELLRVPLPREPSCGAHARGLLQTHLAHHHAAALQDAKTVLSELVNNAFIHGQGAIQLRLSHRQNRLRIEVIDEGAGAEICITDSGLHGGNGLRIVDQLARRWGAREGATHVWADLPLPPLAPTAPLPPPAV